MSNSDLTGKNILVAPLNWGLGHATRSMPVIDLLREWGANVILGGDGRSLHLLKIEYPNLKFIELPSYHVRYTSGPGMVATTLLRIPYYLSAIYREHRLLQRLIGELDLDLVISDNRYGMYSDQVPSVFICHQLAVIPPGIVDSLSPVIHRLHQKFYHRFDQVWVPDFEGRENLTGRLTHKYKLTAKERFTGPLSRFMNRKPSNESVYQAKYVIVLSGPEPQRTILEEMVVRQAAGIDGKFLVVRGVTESFAERKEGNLHIVSFLTASELFDAMSVAEVVISRSGYSTIMDLCFLGKKAVLVPTPGQTEQEYLGVMLVQQGMAVVQDQSSFDLKAALQSAAGIKGFPKMEGTDDLEKVVREFVSRW